MCDENVVKAGQMSERTRENLVVLVPNARDYCENTEIDRVLLSEVINDKLDYYTEIAENLFEMCHLSQNVYTEITRGIKKAHVLLTERRYDDLVDELYCIDVMIEGDEVVEIDDPCTDEEFERELMITPIDQVLTYLVSIADYGEYMPLDGESPADHAMRIDFEEYQLEMVRRIDVHGILIIQEAPKSPVVTPNELGETLVSKTGKTGQIPETGRVDEVI